MSGDVCACGLSLGDGHCRSTTPTLTNNRIIDTPNTNGPRTAIPFGRKAHALTRKCGQRRTRRAVARKGGHAKRNPRLASERAIENRTLPSPHTLARRRFRLAGKCPANPIMRCHRQRQAFSIWHGGQTEWRCSVRWLLRVGCRWVTATARSTTPTLTNDRIIVNPGAIENRTAIPFGRRRMR